MQNKYLSALKTKYASFGLSKEALDRVALQRVKTIANEDEIDTDIASLDTALLIMKEIQGSADSQRNRASALQKELDDLKKTQPVTTPEPTPDSSSEEMREMKAMMQSIMGKMAENEKKTRNEATLAQLHEALKKSGCTNDFIRNITLRGIEIGENDTVESLAERYKSEYDQNFKEAYGEGYTPPRGNGNGNSEPDQDEITRILVERGLLDKSN